MAINYKKELEGAAKSMILVHKPETLIKLIVRRIVQKVKVKHAGILLHNVDKNVYVITFSRGSKGVKIPAGFARMDSDNPLIRLFREYRDHKFFTEGGALVYKDAKRILRKKLSEEIKKVIKGALYQMDIFATTVCIPSYYRDDLLGILLLGDKKNGREFGQDELDFFVALASDVAMAIKNAQLFRNLELELEKKRNLFLHTTIALAAAIEAKDRYTRGHTARVTDLSLNIAKQLYLRDKRVCNEGFFESLHIASLLHDIGKIGVPEVILNKEGPLDDEERKRMKQHSLIGTTILGPIKELSEAIQGVKYHHERYDGTGYPEGLRGNDIPLIAAIISVADAFDAMTTDRPYRKGLSKEEALKQIKQQSGKQFNPEICSALLEIYAA